MTRFAMLLLTLTLVFTLAQAQGLAELPPEVGTTPGPHVVVNGTLLKAPVQKSNGSLLLPMRAVFEALQADVRWFPTAQQIIATRGADTVQLWINKRVAIVNEREIPLAVPPTLFGGITYVPLRFPAEAFGGDVKWNTALQTAIITLTPLGAPATPPAPPVTPVAPPAGPSTSTGVIAGKNTDAGPVVLYQESASGNLLLAQISAETLVKRGATKAVPQPATFADLQPGDAVELQRDAAGKVLSLTATYATAAGKVAGLANNRLLLQDGGLYQLHPQVRAVDTAGTPVALAEIGFGKNITLQFTPGTTTVWLITVAAAAAPPAVTAPVLISVGAVNYTRALKAGDTLLIQAVGTPAAAVTARIGDGIILPALTEFAPGQYRGQVTINPNTNITDAAISATLRLGDAQAPEVRSAHTVTIDTTAPRIDALIPGQNAQVFERNPSIVAAYSDPGGSGIDTARVTLAVNGTDVTKAATITAQGIAYKSGNLPLGASTLRLEVADRAGNATMAEWKVTIADVTQPTAITSLTHDGTGPMQAGQTLKLTAKLAVTPARLEWYLGQRLISEEKTFNAAAQTYTTAYTVQPADLPGDYKVSLRCFTDATKNEVAFAEKSVVIAAAPIPFAVTAPADKTKAVNPMTVEGTATPKAQVRVTVTATSVILIMGVQSELARVTVQAGPDGVWKTQPIDLSVPLGTPNSYSVKVEMLDDNGIAVKTTTLNLTAK